MQKCDWIKPVYAVHWPHIDWSSTDDIWNSWWRQFHCKRSRSQTCLWKKYLKPTCMKKKKKPDNCKDSSNHRLSSISVLRLKHLRLLCNGDQRWARLVPLVNQHTVHGGTLTNLIIWILYRDPREGLDYCELSTRNPTRIRAKSVFSIVENNRADGVTSLESWFCVLCKRHSNSDKQ